jgi:hypothetical protein
VHGVVSAVKGSQLTFWKKGAMIDEGDEKLIIDKTIYSAFQGLTPTGSLGSAIVFGGKNILSHYRWEHDKVLPRGLLR